MAENHNTRCPIFPLLPSPSLHSTPFLACPLKHKLPQRITAHTLPTSLASSEPNHLLNLRTLQELVHLLLLLVLPIYIIRHRNLHLQPPSSTNRYSNLAEEAYPLTPPTNCTTKSSTLTTSIQSIVCGSISGAGHTSFRQNSLIVSSESTDSSTWGTGSPVMLVNFT
ncbi:hypothetical protein Dimus_025543 [Dionaea muscipula]